MSKLAIDVQNISKNYDLGQVGTGTISKDLNRAWAALRGKPDPYATIVEINDRTKKSKSGIVSALRDINFQVEEGEVLGIIGRNGAGKSTLLKVLSQITAPSTGQIKTNGRLASLLEVGTGMHPEMTARENIFLNGSIMGMTRPEIKKNFDDIIDFAGIAKYVDTPIKRFSSGMQVRLGFAVAAFLEPEILIVDEVLAVGDAEFQKRAVGKMQEVTKEGSRTVLFVSHNMGSVKQLCTRGILLANGMMDFDGGVPECIDRYLSNHSDIASSMERSEPNPGKDIYIQKVKATFNDGSHLFPCDVYDTVKIEMEYEVSKDVSNYTMILDLKNHKGDVIFRSFDTYKHEHLLKLRKKGTYKASFEIPSPLLKPGDYYVDIIAGILRTLECDRINDAISFSVDLVSVSSLNCPYSRERPGITAVDLDWQIEQN